MAERRLNSILVENHIAEPLARPSVAKSTANLCLPRPGGGAPDGGWLNRSAAPSRDS